MPDPQLSLQMFGIRRRNYEYDIARHDQSWPRFEEFLHLADWEEISDHAVRSNLLTRSQFDPIYHKSLARSIKQPWPGMESVLENHSQSWQDWLVMTVLDGKHNGQWLELGASDPIYMNNTYLLESQFGWKGISIDKRQDLYQQWQQCRTTQLQLVDALENDWNNTLKDCPGQIDYLQADLADWATLEVLQKLPHDDHRFSVITFEHDVFQSDPEIQRRSRQLLHELGYHLLISNVAVKNYATNTWEPFEDWWIDPTVLNPLRFTRLQDDSDLVKLPHEIFVQQ